MTQSEACVIPAQAGIHTQPEARVIPAQAGIHRTRCIAVLGAPGTGKTRLSQELAAHLAANGLHSDFVVTDAMAAMLALAAGGDLLAFARSHDATLVTGLDLPGVAADGSREEEDAWLRTQLRSAGVPFHVVYGQGPQRLQSALQALGASGVLPTGITRRAGDSGARGAWTWNCEKCSDPECEHRLFSRLRDARAPFV